MMSGGLLFMFDTALRWPSVGIQLQYSSHRIDQELKCKYCRKFQVKSARNSFQSLVFGIAQMCILWRFISHSKIAF